MYTYKIKSTKSFEKKFNDWVGVCRYVYNVAKEVKEEAYKKGVNIYNYDLSRQLTEAKNEHPWLRDVAASTLQLVLSRLDDSFNRFFKKKSNYPKWATKSRWKSIPFRRTVLKKGGFFLPKWGLVKVFGLKNINGTVVSSSITKKADGYYLIVLVKKEKTNTNNRENQSVVGIDLGLKYLYVTSNGEFVENPRFSEKHKSKMRVLLRSMSRKSKGSIRYKKQKHKVALLYLKISNKRKDFLHKQSSILAKEFDYIIAEDLKIKNLVKNSKLTNSLHDTSLGAFVEMLKYKTNVVFVNPRYTSQECSICGFTSSKNRTTQELFKCISCGHTDNADLDAAKIILKRGQALISGKVIH